MFSCSIVAYQLLKIVKERVLIIKNLMLIIRRVLRERRNVLLKEVTVQYTILMIITKPL